MSIINEALKKAGSEKNKPLSNDKIQMTLATEKKSSGLNWGPIFVVLVIVLITTPIIAPIFSTPFKNSSISQAPVIASTDLGSGTRKGQFMVEEFSLKSMPPLSAAAPNWLLSGIVFAPDGSYAIINDKIARAGDSVQGAKLEKIGSDEVVLNYQGQRITLQAAR